MTFEDEWIYVHVLSLVISNPKWDKLTTAAKNDIINAITKDLSP